MNISRTYPQPDSPLANLGPRERALAVFKYLLDLEPEAATQHALFLVIEHAFVQEYKRGLSDMGPQVPRSPSFTEMLRSTRPMELTKEPGRFARRTAQLHDREAPADDRHGLDPDGPDEIRHQPFVKDSL